MKQRKRKLPSRVEIQYLGKSYAKRFLPTSSMRMIRYAWNIFTPQINVAAVKSLCSSAVWRLAHVSSHVALQKISHLALLYWICAQECNQSVRHVLVFILQAIAYITFTFTWHPQTVGFPPRHDRSKSANVQCVLQMDIQQIISISSHYRLFKFICYYCCGLDN